MSADGETAREGAGRRKRHLPPSSRRRFFGSPIRRRILAVNLIALGVLMGGVFYLDDYESRLVDAELAALARQGAIVAMALGETTTPGDVDEAPAFELVEVRQLFKRVSARTAMRLRLFSPTGELLTDSRESTGAGTPVHTERLPEPRSRYPIVDPVLRLYDWIVDWVPRRRNLPPYTEQPSQRAEHYTEVLLALGGEEGRALRADGKGGMVLSAGVPVQQFRQVMGAVLVSAPDDAIDKGLRQVREDILKVFAVALAVTVLLSLYLAWTIARPVRTLADAAERVRFGLGRRHAVPEFKTHRRDEMGDLAGALKDMTEALWSRMDAIERFAADVAHELKNPLSSLRSAVETATRVKDPDQQKRLFAIVQDDVARLDRLIGDIADASRLDAELSREETEPVDVRRMLETLVEVHNETRTVGPRLKLTAGAEGAGLVVRGIEDRLGQVFRNLIDNAVSFSPPEGEIRLSAALAGPRVEIVVEDDGPGIPEGKFEAIFNRFYSERPAGEKFGTHSGLGLSISKQIVEAHGGTIHAENRHDGAGHVTGARFVVRLPR